MTRIFLTAFSALAATGTAHANPGHLADHGHGHTHWPGYALLGLAIAIPVGVTIARRLNKTARI